jgi:hypothetical protein
MISLCACLGPQCGEKFCPCVMETYDLERSAEWKHRNSPEELAKVNADPNWSSRFKNILELKNERTNL